MNTKQDILNKMIYVTENIRKVVADKRATGVKVIGMLPVYTPEELVHAAGLFPVGCWGGSISISKASMYFPPFACSIMQAVMEYAETGTYADLAGFVVPTPCDTLKAVSQNLKYACPEQTVMVISYPQNNKMAAALRYTYSELQTIREQLAAIAGQPIGDEAINQSIELYNQHRAAMMHFFDLLSQKPGALSAINRHYVVKSSYFMDKAEHLALLNQLNILIEREAVDWQGQRIVLAGIMSEPNHLLSIFDEFNMAIVGNELAHECRQFRTPVPAGDDPLQRLAEQWQAVEACSVVSDPQKLRAKNIAAIASDNAADGVIYCQMKFCDPEEFDYPSVKKSCDEANIRLLSIDIDQLVESTEQARTRLQAFSEQLASA